MSVSDMQSHVGGMLYIHDTVGRISGRHLVQTPKSPLLQFKFITLYSTVSYS